MNLFNLALRHGRNRVLALIMIFALPLLVAGCATGTCAKHNMGSNCATCCQGACEQCCKGDCGNCEKCSGANKCC